MHFQMWGHTKKKQNSNFNKRIGNVYKKLISKINFGLTNDSEVTRVVQQARFMREKFRVFFFT